jgi:deoxyribodipyrimidine photolyase
MQAKSVLYAAVGAPVVVARKMTDQVTVIKDKVSKETADYTKVANKTIDDWATEGEKVVSRISEGKVVEEISAKVDLDGAKEQVSKLRDQLEDMLATWRQSFRPEKAAPASKPEVKSASAAKPAAKKPAAKKPAAKTSAAKTTQSSTAAKTSPAKSTAVKAETN